MDPRLQEMLDHYEIRKTLAQYCHACDRADAEAMASVYTGADSFDDHGHVKASGPEYAQVMTNLIHERTDAIWHVLGQSLINVTGAQAKAETFFLAQMSLPKSEAEAKARINQLSGRFLDELIKVDGQWKIKHRTCVRDTSITLFVERDDYASYGFVQGGRDKTDLGCQFIGFAHAD